MFLQWSPICLACHSLKTTDFRAEVVYAQENIIIYRTEEVTNLLAIYQEGLVWETSHYS